jgi:hypothetical protein
LLAEQGRGIRLPEIRRHPSNRSQDSNKRRQIWLGRIDATPIDGSRRLNGRTKGRSPTCAACEVDMPTIRSSEVDRSKKPAIAKPSRGRRRPMRHPRAAEDWHIGATENQMVPIRPPLPDDDEPKQG